jgi:Icc-related predicted phosphoesterase
MRVVCISDTHGRHAALTLPEGDVLVHAGDFSRRGRVAEIESFNAWLRAQSFRYKVVIAGNHDGLFEFEPERARRLLSAAIYLEDSGVEIEGLRLWGSPVTPRFFDWAFNCERGEDIQTHWDLIPADTDLLLVHGPPAGILDRTWLGQSVGCADLRRILGRLQPGAVVFGHIHEAYGVLKQDKTLYVNASSLDRYGRPVQAPWVLDWLPDRTFQVQED